MSNPHMVPQTTSAKGAAKMLGMSTGSFYNKKTSLLAAGFPDRLPGTNRWSIPAIQRWISCNGDMSAAQPPTEDHQIAEAKSRLEQTYSGLAS